MASFLEDIARRVLLLDGGMGTELIKKGLAQGTCPESWNTDRPEAVEAIHRAYFDAGSDGVLTNSFGGSPIKLASYGLGGRCYEMNMASARLAVGVKPEGRFVGGSMGPTGKFLKPTGEFEEGDFQEAFAVQAKGLTEGGADFLLIETMYDLREALCALRAARESSSLPVFVTMTFNRSARGFFTLMGDGVAKCVHELEKAGAAAVGTNCTLDSGSMADLVLEIRAQTALPVVAQPNAGQPTINERNEVVYSQSVEDFVAHVPRLVRNGANIVGGCCGTSPATIRLMAEVLAGSGAGAA